MSYLHSFGVNAEQRLKRTRFKHHDTRDLICPLVGFVPIYAMSSLRMFGTPNRSMSRLSKSWNPSNLLRRRLSLSMYLFLRSLTVSLEEMA